MVIRELESEETQPSFLPPQFQSNHDHVGLDSHFLMSCYDRGSGGALLRRLSVQSPATCSWLRSYLAEAELS